MQHINLNNKTILVTGAAGFIGANLVKRLLTDTKQSVIVGIDNMNNYYDVSLKQERIEQLQDDRRFCSLKETSLTRTSSMLCSANTGRPWW